MIKDNYKSKLINHNNNLSTILELTDHTISAPVHLSSHGNMSMPGLWIEANKPSIEWCYKQVFHDCISILVANEYLRKSVRVKTK